MQLRAAKNTPSLSDVKTVGSLINKSRLLVLYACEMPALFMIIRIFKSLFHLLVFSLFFQPADSNTDCCTYDKRENENDPGFYSVNRKPSKKNGEYYNS